MKHTSNHELPNKAWLAANADTFDKINEHLGQIEDQNSVDSDLIRSGAVTTPELVTELKNALTSEQDGSFTALRAMHPETDAVYAEFFDRWEAVDKRLADLAVSESLAAFSNEDLRRQEQLIKERRPELAAKIGEIVARLEEEGYAELMSSIQAEKEPLLEDDALFREVTAAWVIPQLIDPADYNEAPGSEDLEVIDIYPDDKLSPIMEEARERVEKRLLDRRLVRASEYFGTIFACSPCTTFTREQVAEIMYGGDNRTPRQRVTCVASLVSMHETGKNSIIFTILSAEGLVLQRGKRTVVDANGKIIINRQPIFHAVRLEDAANAESITTTEDDGSVITDGGWVNERAKRTQQLEPELREISPENTLETAIVSTLNTYYRDWVRSENLLDSDGLSLREVLALLGDQYTSVKSLRTSRAWKSGVTGEQPRESLNLPEIIFLSMYPGCTQYLKNPANRKRMTMFIDQAVDSWRAAAAEESSARTIDA